MENKQTTALRFTNTENYGSYICIYYIDMDYDADDTIFTGYIYKLNTPKFEKVTRSEYGTATDLIKILLKFLVIIVIFLLVHNILWNVLKNYQARTINKHS